MLASVGGELVQALSFAFGMFWEVLWALILGFALSAAVAAEAKVGGGELPRRLAATVRPRRRPARRLPIAPGRRKEHGDDKRHGDHKANPGDGNQQAVAFHFAVATSRIPSSSCSREISPG